MTYHKAERISTRIARFCQQDQNISCIPRIVIGGVYSGCGKTTITKGIMQALVDEGLTVQPFKIGPDFIDPSHHTAICGRPCMNLDLFMMGEDAIRTTVAEASEGSDIAIIEGVMGLYDGLEGTSFASTAHVAKILDAPVILVIDAKGMSQSCHAMASGYRDYDPDLSFAGVIFNKIGSERHKTMIDTGSITEHLGFIPKDELFSVESRHLGLYMGDEIKRNSEVGGIIASHCNLCRIQEIASTAPRFTYNRSLTNEQMAHPGVTIGIASDSAFCFYYQHNLAMLHRFGAKIKFFSPMTDPIPEVDALYLGGGYPELYAECLATSQSCRQMPLAADDGMPIYAECGGLLYLSRGLVSEGDRTVKWTGILPGEVTMHTRFSALGYSEGICRAGSGGPSLAPDGVHIRGHEFHYSSLNPDRDAQYAIELSRGTGIANGYDGLYVHNTMGTYTHSYFSDDFTKAFLAAAHTYQRT